MFLIDTSVWIEVLRKGSPLKLESICAIADVVLVLPVYQELLQGIKDEAAFRKTREVLRHARYVENPMSTGIYDDAVDLYRLARAKGFTIRSGIDCLISACAIKHGLTVIHRDRDYSEIKKISALSEKRV